MNNTLTEQITERQSSFLNKLLSEADVLLDERQRLTGADWPEARYTVRQMMLSLDGLTKTEASEKIDTAIDNNSQLRSELGRLQNNETFSPQTEAPRPAEFVTTGMYLVDGRIFKVLPSRSGNGRHYAKELVGERESGYSFEYAKGAMYRIRPEHRMTAEQAAEFGKLTGSCCCCGKLLTDPSSIAKGIGPVCEKKYF